MEYLLEAVAIKILIATAYRNQLGLDCGMAIDAGQGDYSLKT